MELSIGEMLVVFLVILVLFGPDKIPSIARELGQGVRKMKNAVEDIKTEIMKESDGSISDIKKEIDDIKDSVSELNPMNDIQRHIDSVKSSVNSVESTTSDYELEEQKSNIDSNSETNSKKNNVLGKEDVLDKLSDNYSGPVNR